MQRVAIVDPGTGNLHSLARVLRHVAGDGDRVEVTDSAKRLRAADRVVFPGQGAIGKCLSRLRERGLFEALDECLGERPFLGICLGMHVLMRHSEEDGGTPALGRLAGRVRRFPAAARDEAGLVCKVPHMGWNRVEFRAEHPLLRGLRSGAYFYFVHSYYVEMEDRTAACGVSRHGLEFASMAARGSLFATQFHPEKSQRDGMTLLRNFLAWDGNDGSD